MSDNTFEPVIRENEILAGGVRLGRLEGTQLVLEDRWQARCRQRGTQEVRVELEELLDRLLRHYQNGNQW